MPLIPVLRRQRQVDLCAFKAILVCRVHSRTDSKTTQRNPVLKEKEKNVFISVIVTRNWLIILVQKAKKTFLYDLFFLNMDPDFNGLGIIKSTTQLILLTLRKEMGIY